MRNSVFYCRFADDVVVLDLVSDRYRLLRGDGAHRFVKMVEGRASRDDVDWLSQRGIDRASVNYPGQRIIPQKSAVDEGAGKSSLWLLSQSIWFQFRYRLLLRWRPLHEILEGLQRHRSPRTFPDELKSLAIASAFQLSRQYVASQDRCLSRSLALTHMLFRAGFDAHLIIGVTMPFSAHCWVQCNETVLSDPLDRVLPFQPIMILS